MDKPAFIQQWNIAQFDFPFKMFKILRNKFIVKLSNERIAYCQIKAHGIAKYNTDVKCKISAYFIPRVY